MDDRIVTAALVLFGVPAALVGYIVGTEVLLGVARLSERQRGRVRPWLWVAPAVALLTVFLVYPTIDTLRISFYDRAAQAFVGLDNYVYVFTNSTTLSALRNNVLWVVFLTLGTVGGGLIVAVLADRVRYETAIKAIVFIPAAISFVAAGVIWKFMYDYRPPGAPQTGTANALLTTLVPGTDPVCWVCNAATANWALIFVGVWMWIGFCTVILSAGLKGINPELLEAARVDGANEWHVFRRIIFPLLVPTIVVVGTTMVIFALKAFDIVYVMTAGNFDTDVVASQMYREFYVNHNFGRAAAIAIVLLAAIVPVMLFNINRFRQQEAVR